MQSRNRRSPSMTISRRRRVALAYTSFSWGSCKQSCCIRCLAQRSHPTWKMTFRMRRHGATDSSSSSVPTSLRCRCGPTPTGGSTPPRKSVRGGGAIIRQRNRCISTCTEVDPRCADRPTAEISDSCRPTAGSAWASNGLLYTRFVGLALGT